MAAYPVFQFWCFLSLVHQLTIERSSFVNGVDDILQLHPLLADRSRLALMVAIGSSVDALDFSTLQQRLELTKGNLSSHLRKLEEGGLIVVTKAFVDRRPRTTYRCTSEGKAALQTYLESVERVLREALGRSE
jgi:DNA-binding MarR family transcriptional regulator